MFVTTDKQIINRNSEPNQNYDSDVCARGFIVTWRIT